MLRTINIYIFKEIAVPFLLGTAILTVTVLLSKVLKLIDLALNHQLGLYYIFWFLASMLPSILIYTVPGAFLVAVLIACTRMSSDNEIIAMKAAGMSLFNLMKPVLALAALAYVATLALTLYLYPMGNHNIKKLLFEVATESTGAGLEEKVFYTRFKDVVLYVDHIPAVGGEEMRGIFLSVEAPGKGTNIIYAEKGRLVPSREELSVLLKLTNGSMHKLSDESIGEYDFVKFSTYDLELPLGGGSGGGRRKTTRELYPGELADRIVDARKNNRPYWTLIIDLHKRFALPSAIFVFALIGVPLGIQKVRSAKFTGFSVALGVFLVYYVLTKGFEALGDNNMINPVIAAWGSVVLLGTAGLILLYRTAMESPPRLTIWIELATARFKRMMGI